MIHNEVELERAQEEVEYLRGFLSQVEHSPELPNRDLTIIGIYKKLDHLWDELDAYYRARLQLTRQREKGTPAPVAG